MHSEWDKLSHESILQIIHDLAKTKIRTNGSKAKLIDKLVAMDIAPFVHTPLLKIDSDFGWKPRCFAFIAPCLFVGEPGGLFRADEASLQTPRQHLIVKNIDSIVVGTRDRVFYSTALDMGYIHQVSLTDLRESKQILEDCNIKCFTQFARPERFVFDAKNNMLIVQAMADVKEVLADFEEQKKRRCKMLEVAKHGIMTRSKGDVPIMFSPTPFRPNSKFRSVAAQNPARNLKATKTPEQKMQEYQEREAIPIANGTIWCFDLATQVKKRIVFNQTVHGVDGMVVDRQGRLYLSDEDLCQIFVFKQTTEAVNGKLASKKPRIDSKSLESKSVKPKLDVVHYECVDIIGNGSSLVMDGDYTRCSFNGPTYMTTDSRDNWYVFDNQGTSIRKGNSLTRQVTTIFVEQFSPLCLKRQGLSFAILDNFHILTLGCDGVFEEFSPFDREIIYPLARICEAAPQVQHMAIYLIILEYTLSRNWNWKLYYTNPAVESLTQRMERKWLLENKSQQYVEKHSGSHWMHSEHMHDLTPDLGIANLMQCKCPDNEHISSRDKSKSDSLTEWHRHTAVFRDQCLEFFDENDRFTTPLFETWFIKYHGELCCQLRHVDTQAMLTFPKFRALELEKMIVNVQQERKKKYADL